MYLYFSYLLYNYSKSMGWNTNFPTEKVSLVLLCADCRHILGKWPECVNNPETTFPWLCLDCALTNPYWNPSFLFWVGWERNKIWMKMEICVGNEPNQRNTRRMKQKFIYQILGALSKRDIADLHNMDK